MVTRLSEICKKLKISDLDRLSQQVAFESPEQYLTQTLELALQEREIRRINRLIRRAGFPTSKTLEGYDFKTVTFPDSLIKESLLDLNFIERKENILMLGAVGTGKTHLSIALGLKACSLGKTVNFYRAADLTNDLMERHKEGRAGKLIKSISKADLLILDEVGYIPFSKRASELLFTVISNSYEHQSIIITSNLEFGRWNEVFGDDRLTAALIDRLVHHSHILAFSGQSFRFRQAMAGRKEKPTD